MNRTFYFLTLFGLNLLKGALPHVVTNPSIIQAAMLFFVALALVASCLRWYNMGYDPAWGLLTLIPLVPLYGLIMPKDAKTKGNDTAGQIVAAVILVFLIFTIGAIGVAVYNH